jgi:hypothetical protein
LADSKSPRPEQPGGNVGSQRKLRRSIKVEKPADIKRTNKIRSTTATDFLTYALFCLLLKDHKSTLTGSLQPKPSPNISGKGQGAPIEDDDDFEPPRSVAELLQQHQAIEERVRELVRKAERTQLTRAEREFVLCNIRDEDEPNLPESSFPKYRPPETREQNIKQFIETERALAPMRQELDNERRKRDKIEPLTPKDHCEAEESRRRLEPYIGKPIFSKPKP